MLPVSEDVGKQAISFIAGGLQISASFLEGKSIQNIKVYNLWPSSVIFISLSYKYTQKCKQIYMPRYLQDDTT